jgi:hypothetical protein
VPGSSPSSQASSQAGCLTRDIALRLPSLLRSFEHIAVAGPKSELSLLPLRRASHLTTSAIHTRLPYPASINNSLFVSHSSHLATPLVPATGKARPPWGGSEGIRVGVSNNDGSVRVMGVERPGRLKAEGELRSVSKKQLNQVGEVEIPVSVNHSAWPLNLATVCAG